MPKKTRGQKIAAQKRREAYSTAPAATATFQFRMPEQATKQAVTQASENSTELRVIKRDLVKTMILAMIAIAAEYALYLFKK